MSSPAESAVSTARDYYNSEDADNFYHQIWGGEDIHVGLYRSAADPIDQASRRTVQYMASKLPLTAESHVLDLGSGYGGAARYLAQPHGCRVTALNLSEVENQRNRAQTAEQGLTAQITVIDGSFEQVPLPDSSVDVVWSQDAILHSGNREQVLAEAFRVLRPGGRVIFTDPMQTDDCPPDVLKPILDRIHLANLGSPGFYLETADRLGFTNVSFEPLTDQLVYHYSRVLEETERQEHKLNGISPDYLERMRRGLRHWIDGGQQRYLAWGIFLFHKPLS